MEKNFSALQITGMAIRPKTLPAALAPVFIGSVLAWKAGVFHGLSASLALGGALLIQIGTNLANDYFDFQKGADTEERVGPQRVTQSGLVAPYKVKLAFILVFLLAFILSLYLMVRGGWPIVFIGVFSIASGILYTGGPYPLGYLGLGDLFVFIFFGPVAVGGTYYVQALELPLTVLFIGIAPGLLSMAILAVNNLRDRITDQKAGKKTLAVRFGATFVQVEYLLCLLGACAVPLVLYLQTQQHPYSLLALGILIPAIPALRQVFSKEGGTLLNPTLAQTGKLLLLYSILFSLGWLF